jgi:F420H(2)-dependent quinone reductase
MPLPSWVEQGLLPRVLRVHDAVYQGTNGWIGHHTLGIPSLLLHTVGAKTGQARTASLTYARDGDDYLIVASKGGDPKAPGWYHNLKANPSVEINVGPKRFRVTAHPVLPDDPDYARLWQIVNKNNSNRYEAYQTKTSRPIPVVALKRA